MIAGFVPNPMKKRLKPMTIGESAIENNAELTILIIMAILSPSFLPELSAMVGMNKKPNKAPM